MSPAKLSSWLRLRSTQPLQAVHVPEWHTGTACTTAGPPVSMKQRSALLDGDRLPECASLELHTLVGRTWSAKAGCKTCSRWLPACGSTGLECCLALATGDMLDTLCCALSTLCTLGSKTAWD